MKKFSDGFEMHDYLFKLCFEIGNQHKHIEDQFTEWGPLKFQILNVFNEDIEVNLPPINEEKRLFSSNSPRKYKLILINHQENRLDNDVNDDNDFYFYGEDADNQPYILRYFPLFSSGEVFKIFYNENKFIKLSWSREENFKNFFKKVYKMKRNVINKYKD